MTLSGQLSAKRDTYAGDRHYAKGTIFAGFGSVVLSKKAASRSEAFLLARETKGLLWVESTTTRTQR